MVAIMAIYILVGRELWRRNQRVRDMQKPRSPGSPTDAKPTAHVNTVFADKAHYHKYNHGSFLDDEEHLTSFMDTDKGKSYDITISYSPANGGPVKATPDAYSVNVTARSLSTESPRPVRSDHAKSSTLHTYVRTAFLFWIIFVITWMPSSINRVYSLGRSHGSPSFALSMLSCITLPLQGFWNAVVFTVIGTRDWNIRDAAPASLRGWIGRIRSRVGGQTIATV